MSTYSILFPIIFCHFQLTSVIQNVQPANDRFAVTLNYFCIFLFSYYLYKSNRYNITNPVLTFSPLTNTMPGSFLLSKREAPISRSHKCLKQNKNSTTKKVVLPSTNNASDHSEQPSNKPTTDNIANQQEQWTVVSESKKPKKTSTCILTVAASNNKNNSTPKQSAATKKKVSKKSKASNSKASDKKSNTKTNKHGKHPSKPPSAPTQLWADIVSENKKGSAIDVSSDDMDLPALSDSESTTGTIESPCLSVRSLPQTSTSTVNNYYSLFDTGFNLCSVIPKDNGYRQHSSTYNVPSSNTRSLRNFNKKSILDMLDQDQQAQTSITPACFSYFGEMMMSTSLYKYDQYSAREEQWNQHR